MTDDDLRRHAVRDDVVADILAAVNELLADWRPGDRLRVSVRTQTPAEALTALLGDAAPAVEQVRGQVELSDVLTVEVVKDRPLGHGDLRRAQEAAGPVPAGDGRPQMATVAVYGRRPPGAERQL